MAEEFAALQSQNTWTLVPSNPNQNAIGTKWIYKLKLNSDGTIASYKAQLVAQGFKQEHGLD